MKMKFSICFLLILLFQTSPVVSQDIINPPILSKAVFESGEKLIYQMRYGFITSGIATLSISDVKYQQNNAFHSFTLVETTGLADKIYGVKDIYESWFDKETNLPYKQIRNIKEGRYKRYNEVTYNRKDNTVYSKLSGIHAVPENILDLSSSLYFIRRVDFFKLSIGDVILQNMYFGDEVFPFRFIYQGQEIVQTSFGKISCLKISPIVEVGRMFKKSDDVTIWISDDGSRIPISICANIRIVGTVYLKLLKYENTISPLIFY